MKTLRDSLERLFGTSPESTPAIPAALREAAAAEAASLARYEYPRVPSLDDLPPDVEPGSSPQLSAAPPPPQERPFAPPPSLDLSVREDDVMCEYVPGPSEGTPETRDQTATREPDACYQASALDGFLSDLKACDPRAFSKRLQQGVREVHGGNPVAFYNAAGISRSAYSRLISHPDRHPSKDTVLCMAAALRMSLPDAENLLRLAGYALSPHIPADLVWQRCFQQGIHELPVIRSFLDRAPSPSH